MINLVGIKSKCHVLLLNPMLICFPSILFTTDINQILNIVAIIFQNGLIVVADRSNNRVQVFSGIGQYLHKFGVEGKGPGQFNKPASVCADSR